MYCISLIHNSLYYHYKVHRLHHGHGQNRVSCQNYGRAHVQEAVNLIDQLDIFFIGVCI